MHIAVQSVAHCGNYINNIPFNQYQQLGFGQSCRKRIMFMTNVKTSHMYVQTHSCSDECSNYSIQWFTGLSLFVKLYFLHYLYSKQPPFLGLNET